MDRRRSREDYHNNTYVGAPRLGWQQRSDFCIDTTTVVAAVFFVGIIVVVV